jgi:hypothetical protein
MANVIPKELEIDPSTTALKPHSTPSDKTIDDIDQLKCQFSPRISRVWDLIPKEMLDLSDEEIGKTLGPQGITKQDSRIKINFWRNYDFKTVKLSSSIDVHDFVRGLTSAQHWQHRVAKHPQLLVYWLRRPVKYDLMLEECLNLGLERLRDEILTAKFQFPNGHLDPKAASVLMQALVFLDNRVQGPLKQRVEITSTNTNRNVNVNVDLGSPKRATTIEELDKKLAELRQKLDDSAVIDVQTNTNVDLLPESHAEPLELTDGIPNFAPILIEKNRED